MCWVVMRNAVGEVMVVFAPNIGVQMCEEALSLEPEEFYPLVKIAFDHVRDPLLVDACCGGEGRLAGHGEIGFDYYLEILANFERENPVAQ
jgi:hypothetical protein